MECKFSKRNTNLTPKVKIGDHIIPHVTRFRCLLLIIQDDGEIDRNVNHMIQKAEVALTVEKTEISSKSRKTIAETIKKDLGINILSINIMASFDSVVNTFLAVELIHQETKKRRLCGIKIIS
ncbi:hypothetical protein Lal_00049339 [Lupinus albus]|nr:hypothetical protein Lal_00049339 [Lupinus albus]